MGTPTKAKNLLPSGSPGVVFDQLEPVSLSDYLNNASTSQYYPWPIIKSGAKRRKLTVLSLVAGHRPRHGVQNLNC